LKMLLLLLADRFCADPCFLRDYLSVTGFRGPSC
jgi:hypothetical protein